MKCAKCQFENPESKKFCGECGAKLVAVCPNCQYENPPLNKFCGDCGCDLSIPESKVSQSPKKESRPAILTSEQGRKYVTVLFSDLSGYTAMTEKLDPEEVKDIMDRLFGKISQVVVKYEGFIEKYVGDAVMAIFGIPKAHEDDPVRAIRAAWEIHSLVKEISPSLENKIGRQLSMHTGINTGLVVAMEIDFEKGTHGVLGDTINIASRISGLAKADEIIVGHETYHEAEGYFDFEHMGEVKVKGKEQPIKAYKVIEPRHVSTRIDAGAEKGLSPFIGRNKELDHLKDRFEQASEGHGQVVGVLGEPGVGKSRLVCQFRDSLPAEEYTIIEGGCIHFGDMIPYLPILDILKDYFDIKENEKEAAIKEKINKKVTKMSNQLVHTRLSLYEILSLKVEDEEYIKLDAKQRHDRVFEAIRLLLIAESQKRPLVVIIEDLHWIDKTSEEFLTFLIGSLATTRILLLLLFRPEYIPSWVGNTYYSQIRVEQFPPKSTADLLRGILETEDVEPGLDDFIARRTEGNPLFIEELTYNLLENGAIKKNDNRYSLSLRAPDIQVPATIQGIITARLDRLEGNLKKIMQMASVIGREFAFRILQTVATLREDLKSSLLTLQKLEFIYKKAIFPELEYIFKHALTQEVAYNSLLLKRRKETHERVGQAIETIYADRLEEFYEILAYHYSLSNDFQKAYQYLKLSGDKAVKNYSNWEAIRFYKEAVRVMDIQPVSEESQREKLKVCLSLLTPLWFVGYPEGSLEIFQESEMLAQELVDENTLATIYSLMGRYYTYKGNVPLAMEYSEKCFDLAERIESIELMAQTTIDACVSNWFAGHAVKVFELSRRILPLLEDCQREKDLYVRGGNAYSGFSAYCGVSLGSLGEFAEGKIVLEKGLQNASEINDRYATGWVEFCHSVLSFWEGDVDNTVDHAQKALKCYEDTGAVFMVGIVWTWLGAGYYLRGKYETAREYADKGFRMQEKIGVPFMTAMCSWHLALILCAAGDLIQARECAEVSLKLAQEHKVKNIEGQALMLIGILKGKMDPACIDEAQHQIQKGIMIVEELRQRPLFAIGYLFLGELFADAGRNEEAQENLKKAESMYLEMKVTSKSYWLKRTQEALAKLG